MYIGDVALIASSIAAAGLLLVAIHKVRGLLIRRSVNQYERRREGRYTAPMQGEKAASSMAASARPPAEPTRRRPGSR